MWLDDCLSRGRGLALTEATTRRDFIGSLLAASAFPRANSASVQTPVIKGTIRWDAWYARTGASVYAQRSLGPEKFQWRAPVHCRSLSSSEIQRCIGTPDVMAAEINAASQAGIDYWAFVWYSEQDSGMHAAWSSSSERCPSSCEMVHDNVDSRIRRLSIFSIDGSTRSIDRVLDLLSQDNYQRVVNGRPRVYILWNDSDVTKYFNASTVNVSGSLEQLRERAARRRMADPYAQMMGSSPTEFAMLAHMLGCDAISSYISSFSKHGPQPLVSRNCKFDPFG